MRGSTIHRDGSDVAGAFVANKFHGASRITQLFALFILSFRDGPKDQTKDAQLRIGESRDSGFDASHLSGMTVYFFSAGSRCTGSIQSTVSGFSTGSISRLIATASPSLRTSTHSSAWSGLALIS